MLAHSTRCVCVRARGYLNVCVRESVCVCVCVRTSVCACVCVCMYARVHACTRVDV